MTLRGVLRKLHEPPAPWRVDARFHSALVSGAVSSPDLTTAYGWPTADALDLQLNTSMSAWLGNTRKGSMLDVRPTAGKKNVSFSLAFGLAWQHFL